MRLTTFSIVLAVVAACTDPDTVNTSAVSQAAISVQRGTDAAPVLTTSEALVLKNTYGVTWTGVYIGGSCNGGSGWTKAAVTAIANATGWTFMPIWVGSQASSICGQDTLTYARGMSDGVSTASTMASFGWGANLSIPVALDVEAGTYEDDPTSSTNYIQGWLDAVHAAGYLGYIYSSPTGIVHYANAGLAIDAAWVAEYPYTTFENVTPADLTSIGNLFNNHNRAWQYCGDTILSGAGDVDCDTSDWLLAPAPGGANATCATLPAAGGIIDQTDPCFDAGGPTAYMRPVTDAGYNNDLIWTHTTDAATEANFGQWNLSFAQAGTYHVDVYTAAAYAQSKQAAYVITGAGSASTVIIDQTAADGWQGLGDFAFAAGSDQQIHLGDNTGEAGSGNIQLVFDAVRVTPSTGSGSDGSDSGSADGSDGSDGSDRDGSDTTMPAGHGGGCAASGGAGLFAAFPLVLALRRRRR
jgi:hypothetical protein